MINTRHGHKRIHALKSRTHTAVAVLKHTANVCREPVALDLGIPVVKDANDAGSGSVKRPRKLLESQTVALRKLEQPCTLTSCLRQFCGFTRCRDRVGFRNHLKRCILGCPHTEVDRRKLQASRAKRLGNGRHRPENQQSPRY